MHESLQPGMEVKLITSLVKEVMFLVVLVCLFVCVVDNITQKVINRLE